MADGGHPTAMDSYLAALVFYATITGKRYGSWVMGLAHIYSRTEWPSGTEIALWI
jgi:hypothetical protein